MADLASLRVTIPSCPEALGRLRTQVEQVAGLAGFDAHGCGLIALAIDEALTNVIRHGYLGRPDGTIELSVTPTQPPGLTVVIEDRGRTVDPATIQGRDLQDVRPGGLGVHLMREIMDSCQWQAREGGGMRLTMCKSLAPCPR